MHLNLAKYILNHLNMEELITSFIYAPSEINDKSFLLLNQFLAKLGTVLVLNLLQFSVILGSFYLRLRKLLRKSKIYLS